MKPDTQKLIAGNFDEARSALDRFISEEGNFERIEQAASLLAGAIAAGGKIIACGNGGSLCDATHFAEELTGRFRENRQGLPAIAINDPAYITCVANDFSYDQIYSRYVRAVGQPADALLAISTSGNSENILQAAIQAREMGMKVVALTGKSGGALAGNCDVEIRAPKTDYSDRAQEIHIKVIHTLVQLIEIRLS